MAFEAPSVESLLDFALTLGLGALIGIERERHRTEKMVLAGVRTYPLVALSGLVAASVSRELEVPVLVSVGAFIVGGFALLMYWVRQAHGTTGLTSPIALFSTYFVGVLVGVDRQWEAIVAGLAIALLLFTKERLHHVAEVLTPQEMEGALYFLVLAFIAYPVLPADPIDPWDLLRLQNVLLIILLVSLISFVSFLAMRRWGGEFGLPFSGFLGGLVNSEATTASLARLHRHRTTLQRAAYAGILLATGTMFVRNLFIAAIADPGLDLLAAMLVPMLWPSLILVAWAFLALRDGRRHSTPLVLESPFAFRPAFVFAVWFTLVSVATVLLTRWPALGDRGVYVAALGGIVSAGAVTASMGTLVATGNAAPAAAGATAVLASLVSAANKVVIAHVGAGGALATRIVPPVLASIAAGGVLLLWLL